MRRFEKKVYLPTVAPNGTYAVQLDTTPIPPTGWADSTATPKPDADLVAPTVVNQPTFPAGSTMTPTNAAYPGQS